MQKNQGKQELEQLWCLPYDTDSIFKPFLKIPFSVYLNTLISNENFPRFQASVAKEIKDRSSWNEKCWLLLKYFEFMNEAFDVGSWDECISFIEDSHLRHIMGCFRLWIDTERLYLLSFLKLDSNQFQEDRIFMSLFRTLIFQNYLFNEYIYSDFDSTFLNSFIASSISHLTAICEVSTIDTADLVSTIIVLLRNLSKHEKILIELNRLQSLRKSAAIKVSKESEIIKEVENRLQNSAMFKNQLDDEVRLHRIARMEKIDDMAIPVRALYDPISQMHHDYKLQSQLASEDLKQDIQKRKIQQIADYKKRVLGSKKPTEESVYNILEKRNDNPYSMRNYQLYGEVVKIDMEEKSQYEKEKVVEVASVDQNEKSRFIYDESFLQMVEQAHSDMGRVTRQDINTSTRNNAKKSEGFKNQDENTRVFNLKWHQDPNSSRLPTSEQNDSKDYDNNLLFKSPLEELMLEHKKNNLDRLKEDHGVNSYTIALNEEAADEIFAGSTCSQGNTLFVKRMPQFIDTNKYRLVNHNKFDFMRKVAGYMAAQKKIMKIISLKPVPDLYPRHYSDVRQLPYDPTLQVDKANKALGRTQQNPRIFL